jgi:hypothetical protein
MRIFIGRIVSIIICTLLLAQALTFCFLTFTDETANIYQGLTLTAFCFVAIGLSIILLRMILIIRKHFKEDMHKERVHLQISQATFVGTFLLRTGLITLVIKGSWADYSTDMNEENWKLYMSWTLFT